MKDLCTFSALSLAQAQWKPRVRTHTGPISYCRVIIALTDHGKQHFFCASPR